VFYQNAIILAILKEQFGEKWTVNFTGLCLIPLAVGPKGACIQFYKTTMAKNCIANTFIVGTEVHWVFWVGFMSFSVHVVAHFMHLASSNF
jgi:hypothetical protein